MGGGGGGNMGGGEKGRLSVAMCMHSCVPHYSTHSIYSPQSPGHPPVCHSA